MTEEEIIQWMQESEFVCGINDYDERGNNWKKKVYKLNDDLYLVEFCNGSPIKEFGKKTYAPIKVVKKSKMVEKVYFYDENTKREYLYEYEE